MKNFAIVRIIIWSIVAVICFSMLYAGLFGRGKIFSFPELNIGAWSGYVYGNSDKYSVGGGSVSADDIQSVEINWPAGSVDVVTYDDWDDIKFNEEGYNGADEKYAMRYLAENGKLIIRFSSPQRNWRFLRRLEKSLTVKLPRNLALHEFRLNSVSADVRLVGIHAENFIAKSVSGTLTLNDINSDNTTMESVSGNIDAADITSSTLRAKTVSGRVEAKANIEKAKLNTVSGAVKLYTGKNVKDIAAGTVSGNILLGLPENDGFTVRYSSVSGGFHCEFPVEMSGKRGNYKNGDRDISFETVSGSINIIQTH